MSVKNFNRKISLFAQPKTPPKYPVCVKSQGGIELELSCPRTVRLALALMDMQAVVGGAASHWGGPSAFVEVVSALYALVFHTANKERRPWYELFHLINDAGHCENGLYALKANYGMGGMSFADLKGFRSFDSPLAGHGEAHLFPEGVYLSNGPLASTLAQAQGLCMADRLQDLGRVSVVLMSDGACMEGEAKEAFSSIPGFFKKGLMNPFIVIASDNNTKLSGRIDEDSFSLDPFFRSLKVQGWEYVECGKAHHLQACVDVLEEVLAGALAGRGRGPARAQKPVFVRMKTVKGFGIKEAEEASHGGHGFPLKNTSRLLDVLKEIYGSKDIPEEFAKWAEELIQNSAENSAESSSESPTKNSAPKLTQKKQVKDGDLLQAPAVKAQEGIGHAMVHCREERGFPVVSVSADLQGSTGVLPFRKRFPKFSFDVGVAEANMISVAGGFSKQGFIPVVDTFTQFGVTKGALPLFMANLSQAPVIAVFSHAGFQDAADGASHQCLTYLAQTGALPMTDVYYLSSCAEAFALMVQAVESFAIAYREGKVPRTQVFFLGRETFPKSYLPSDYAYKLGRAQVVYSGLEKRPSSAGAVTLWAVGPLVREALLAGQALFEEGFKVIVVNGSIVNRPDMETLLSCLQKTNFCLVTVEDHRLTGGMGAQVAQSLALKGVKTDMLSLAVGCDFGRSAYKSLELYQREGLTSKGIVQAVRARFFLSAKA